MVIDVNNVLELIKIEGERRRYSQRTIETYQKCIEKFLKFCNKDLRYISKKDAREFLEDLSKRDVAGSTLNVYHMAIKFLLEDILNKKMKLRIKYSRVPKKLPTVLSKGEIKRLFNAIENPKHRLMIELMYSAGLRVSELVNLKVEDLNMNEGYGYVRSGKGRKDRIFIIAEKLKERLSKNIARKKLNEYDYLFLSAWGRKYSIRSLQQIIKKARKKAEIAKEISCHTLRHSFATHLIENGYSVMDVQLLLGHKSPETTAIYLHTSPRLNIKSPIDSL